MHYVHLDHLLRELRLMISTAHAMQHAETEGEWLAEAVIKAMQAQLVQIKTFCDEIELKVTTKQAQRFETWLAQCTRALRKEVLAKTDNLLEIFDDEIAIKHFLHLPDNANALYVNARPFGDTVCHAFPGAVYDSEEAAKCLALDRFTACVFHCMRVVEVGIKAIITSFGDEEHYWSWGKIISRVGREASKSDDAISPKWQGRHARLNEINMLIGQLKDACRNSTMHVGRRYFEKDALGIFVCTATFMARLAEDLSEYPATDDSSSHASSTTPAS